MKTIISNLFIVLSLISLPNPIFGQAPDLGTASDFAVFTAIGAFGNSGASTISGNIGTQAGEFSGFPPGTLTGASHVADPNSYQASLDVSTAYDQISAITCGIVLGTTLGNDQTLTPEVYCLGAASALNGDLILDGNGDSNALFIFKINGALSTSSLSRVVLINSALASHVYWSINGEFTGGSNSLFKGTLLVNGSITLLESSSLEGRALSRDGAVLLNNNLVEIKTSVESTLPVELISFDIQLNKSNTGAILTWKTASELNSSYFLVERSSDGIHFESIGKLEAAGFSNQFHAYCFTDDSPIQGFNYYRLNQFDFDGLHEYSAVKAVEFNYHGFYVTIFPNPFASSIEIVNNEFTENKTVELRIYDAIGKPMLTRIITKKITTLETADFPSGAYMYVVIVNQNVIQSGNLVAL
jgi:hypothetical protein